MRNQTEDSRFLYGALVTCKLRVATVNRTNKNEARLIKPHWLSQTRTWNGAAKSEPNGRSGLLAGVDPGTDTLKYWMEHGEVK